MILQELDSMSIKLVDVCLLIDAVKIAVLTCSQEEHFDKIFEMVDKIYETLDFK